ncbi:MAG: proline--tRNA ligase [Coriobacteriales bacterium]|jgi:prolyl-tRNA synthetase|nr:proline--tRNA ligase [Coriobacteriales bacterium]
MPLIDTRIIRLSRLYAPTLREDPVDAELASHRLLLRAAMIRKVASGVYSFLPLGMRALRKLEQIVREEQDAIGAQEMLMSIIQPAELWYESGRWEVYGPELMHFKDRHEHSFALSPTQEELITVLVRDELRSYRELPQSLYHIQWKYRDEIRPRFGLLRAREFLMKDAYSFHASHASLQQHYDDQARSYGRICERLGLTWRAVEADSGQIGGKVTREFMALAPAGEARILYCSCGFAANAEAASARIVPQPYDPDGVLETGCGTIPAARRLSTPDVGTIAALARFLQIEERATVKALAGRAADGQPSVVFLPGSHELAVLKLPDDLAEFEPLDDEGLARVGLIKGFIGPVGLPKELRIYADRSLEALPFWLVGANEPNYHLAYATPGRDFTIERWIDVAAPQTGDLCPLCSQPLEGQRGIEVGQVFQLGTKYSESLAATYMDEDGNEQPFIMGSYGWGVSRSLAAIVEQHHDDAGIIWPLSVAPAEVAVLMLAVHDDLVQPAAEQLAKQLAERGIEVVLDDRDVRAGVKFNDADLIGWPYQVLVGRRGLEAGQIELKERASGIRTAIDQTTAVDTLTKRVREERRRYLLQPLD